MNSCRIYLVSALSIVVLVVLAMLWVNSERYYPLVRLALPDQSELIFIDSPWTDQKKCQDANLKITGALRKNCGQCRIVDSCAKQLDPSWRAALAGQSIKNYVVHSGSLRIVVNAGNASKQTCIVMAEQITNNKKQAARCVSPL